MTDKTDSEDYSLARMYHLSDADKDILKLCQRVMISRCEAAWIWERQETYTGNELRRLTDRRIELYDQIDKDMVALEGYSLESLYAARRVLEVVVNVLGHRFMDSEGWLGKGPIERLLVRVLEAVTTGAEDEARTKWRAVHAVPVQGNVA